MEKPTVEFAKLFREKRNYLQYLCSNVFYITIIKNIYLKPTYFAVIIWKITLARLVNSSKKHVDVGSSLAELSTTASYNK